MMIESIFSSILVLSVQASLIIALLWVIRRLFHQWIRPKWAYALWFLVLLKLTSPWLPTSGLSIENIVPPLLHSSLSFDHNETEPAQQETGVESGEALYQEPPVTDPWSTVHPDFAHTTDSGEKLLGGSQADGWLFICSVLWLIGAFLFMIVSVVQYMTCTRKWKQHASPVQDPSTLQLLRMAKENVGVRKSIDAYYSTSVKSPALFGFWRAKILLPDTRSAPGVWDREAILAAFEHELWHWKRKDIWANVWFHGVLAIHWFNPLLWLAYRQFRTDQETACDASILANRSEHERIRYGLVLLRTLESQQNTPVHHVGVSLFGNQNVIRRRIQLIAKYKKPTIAYTVCAAVLFALLSVALLTNASADTVEAEKETTPTTGNEDQVLSSDDDTFEHSPSFVMPVSEGQITRLFGTVLPNQRGEEETYTAIAIANELETPIVAAAAGTVQYAAYDVGFGNRVVIDHGDGWTTTYSHLHSIEVEEGTVVAAGDRIGTMGSTGRSTGVHLRFEVIVEDTPLDPLQFFTEDERARLSTVNDLDRGPRHHVETKNEAD